MLGEVFFPNTFALVLVAPLKRLVVTEAEEAGAVPELEPEEAGAAPNSEEDILKVDGGWPGPGGTVPPWPNSDLEPESEAPLNKEPD